MTTLSLDEALKQAIEHHKAGRIAQAEALYMAILRTQPNHPLAAHNMAALALQVGRPSPSPDRCMRSATESRSRACS